MPVRVNFVTRDQVKKPGPGPGEKKERKVSPMKVSEDPGLDRPPKAREKPPAMFLADVKIPGR